MNSDADQFPDTLDNLILINEGSLRRPGCLPVGLKSLLLDNLLDFDRPLWPGILPPRLESLKLGRSFNQPIPRGALPATIKELSFGVNFNQPLDINNLPPSLTNLSLAYSSFNHALSNLPTNLTHLALGADYNQPIDCLPPLLEMLRLSSRSPSFKPNATFPQLKVLLFTGINPDVLANVTSIAFPSLVNLKIHGIIEQPNVETGPPLDLGHLPSTLKSLLVITKRTFTSLPNSIDTLTLGHFTRGDPITIVRGLPHSLTALNIFSYIHQIDIEALPSSLRSLEFTHSTREVNDLATLVSKLPESVVSLKLSGQPYYLLKITNNLFFKYSQNLQSTGFIDLPTLQAYIQYVNTQQQQQQQQQE
ncbi:hypothetical protein SAMD00019534_075290 [Acytostelium subglobosum LB1]|uniref:hypothetical protein n=1 Tax=Acytostelium subglobosum LB1 TaxID=1410327 RepID=UPI0006451177|nr:hypothetical protein SAMD00019534_075290 [Acytostelium subglobosum LB1]GAM24354.1 hypothetical protein SAMD00019534_075290 [Acytostelium subglobosum LB1]|eukprot:XP_012752680.1 hypothetical protein SAMD00019534_075290 [Acytostelium subglobosum LB1]